MDGEDILILGAGPAGMACAMELYKAGLEFSIAEKDKQAGGLAKTYQFGEFRTDNGPHRFFSQNKYLYDFIEDLLGERWIKVNRFTRFYINGKFYKYPVELKDTLVNLGPFNSLRAFSDYIIENTKFYKKSYKNFEEYAVSTFGRTLAEFNILNYTEKIWGIPCSQLSVDWATQRIKGLNIISLIKNVLLKSKGPKTLVDQFCYPSLGTGLIYEEIKKKIENKNQLLLENEPVKIILKDNKIIEVILKNGERYKPKHLVSSIPITAFIDLIEPSPPKNVLDASKKLKYRSQVYLFLTINKPSISKDQWIYFPDKEIPFGRISEMKNFSKKMSPEDKTSLFIEFFCWEGDEIWNETKEGLFESAFTWLNKFEFLKREEVVDIYHIKRKDIYPVYTLDYKEHLDVVKGYLDKISNLIYTGRPGRFKYTNQDHSLEMGILGARSIIEGKQYNLDEIGAERDYFERGYIS